MTSVRKLQGEIDKTLKKVQEGVTEFDLILKKVYAATSSNQKDKYEGDLKKEIKKLQRYRDQIKGWIASNEVKNKAPLLDCRKLVEQKMEQFKACEKETKTKAYSKEALGSQGIKDNDAKIQVRYWSAKAIQNLKTQIEQFEFDVETLTTAQKKKKNSELAAKVESTQKHIERHKFHLRALAFLVRSMEIDRVAAEEIEKIKESVEYYIENYEDENCEEPEDIYSPFNLKITESEDGDDLDISIDDSEDEEASSNSGDEINDDSSEEPKETASATTATTSKSSPSLASSGSISTTVLPNVSGAPRVASPPTVQPTTATPSTPSSSTTPSSASTAATTTPSTPSSSTPASRNVTSSPTFTSVSKSQNQLKQPEVKPLNPQPVVAATSTVNPSTTTTTAYPPALGNIPMSQRLTQLHPPQQPQPQPAIQPTTTPPPQQQPIQQPIQQPQQPQQPQPTAASQIQQQLLHSYAMRSKTNVNTGFAPQHQQQGTYGKDDMGDIKDSIAQMSLKQQIPQSSSPPGLMTGDGLGGIGDDIKNNETFDTSTFYPTGTLAELSSATMSRLQSTDINGSMMHPQQQMQQQQQYGSGMMGQDVSSIRQQSQSFEDNLSLTRIMMETSYKNLPDFKDYERLPTYIPKTPKQTPQYYPQYPLPIFENPAIYEKFDIDTLFFIFYFKQGTYQQYLASRELKKQGWRYHKKYLTWFRRHEEPKLITPDFEQGTYVYFDYETGWCQRKKTEFTFEYRFLEE